MKNNKFIIAAFIVASTFGSCKDELNVQNPNQPTVLGASTENGLIALAKGGVYVNGFRGLADKYVDGVPGYFWSGAVGFHDIMGDVIACEAANWFLNQIGCPNSVVLDSGVVINNPQSPSQQYDLLRDVNSNDQQGANPIVHEWANMYGLNNACNNILELNEKITFSGDATAKKNTIKAWAYWWKGFAYSRLGSIYHAGLINDKPNTATSVYVTREALIAEATKNLDAAAAALGNPIQTDILQQLIPNFCQVGKGGVLSPDEWKRNINTLKARNILVNTTTANMTSAQWASITALTNDGIKATDKVFTGRSNPTGDVWSASGGFVSAKTASAVPGENTYKVSERWVQDFKTGDKRKDNNLVMGTTWIGNSDRGNAFNTRWGLVDGGNAMAGVIVYANTAVGAYELFLAGSYEENELMKAEVKIYSGDIAGGMAIIDAVRTLQGAGLPATGTLTASQAKEELRKERRCALAFRGVAFYDARRSGIIEPSASRTGCVVVDKNGRLNTNATIKYGFLDYWDVPDNELAYNAPTAGSAPVKNPK